MTREQSRISPSTAPSHAFLRRDHTSTTTSLPDHQHLRHHHRLGEEEEEEVAISSQCHPALTVTCGHSTLAFPTRHDLVFAPPLQRLAWARLTKCRTSAREDKGFTEDSNPTPPSIRHFSRREEIALGAEQHTQVVTPSQTLDLGLDVDMRWPVCAQNSQITS